MTKLTASVESTVSGRLAGTPDLGTTDYDFSTQRMHRFTDGISANQANSVFTDTRAIVASGTDPLDLSGVLAGALGGVIAFTAIKAIRVFAHADNVNDVVIGGAASNVFRGPFVDITDKLAVAPGGQVLLVNPGAAGWPVTAGTGDLLLVANGGAGTAVAYDIEIIGEA